jgi:hypothetical protein
VKRLSPLSFAASLTYHVIASANFPTLACAGCRGWLDVHQPDPNQPDQVLGTCANCGRWYRIGFSTKGKELIVLELPDLGQITATPPPASRGDGKA